MPKVEKMTSMQGKTALDAIKARAPTKWGEMFDTLTKEGGAVKVTDLSRGAAWGLKKTALSKGFEAKITDKGATLVISTKAKVPPKL